MRVIRASALFAWVLVASSAVAQPAAMRDTFFVSNGVRIRYVEQGSGSPVVLLHGLTGSVERHWIAPGVFAKLAEHHRVIAMDLRGHGKSGKPTDPAAYGIEMSRDVVRLLDHLGIRRASIVGYSLGAIMLGPLIAQNRDRIQSAVFVGHHPVTAWTAEDESRQEEAAKQLEGDMPFRWLIVGLSPPGVTPTDEQIRTMSQGLLATNDPKALAAVLRGFKPLVVTESALRANQVPVMGIIGSLDPNAASLPGLTKYFPAMQVVILDGATHGGEQSVLRRPEFVPALKTLLIRLRGSAVARTLIASVAYSNDAHVTPAR